MTACFKRSGYFETKPERRADVSSANGDVKLHDSPVCPEGAANYCRVEPERDAVVEELKEYPALARLDVCTWHSSSVTMPLDLVRRSGSSCRSPPPGTNLLESEAEHPWTTSRSIGESDPIET